MFLVLLRFSSNRGRAEALMKSHLAWIASGLDDGVFLLAGTLEPGLGGGILAHDTSRSELQARVAADPFVAEHVVSAEILEITPARVDERLSFLAGPPGG